MNLFGWLAEKRPRAAGAIALFVLVGLPLHVAVKESGEANLPPLGSRAPVLQGPTIAGGSYDSLNDRGRVLVLVFLDPDERTSREQGTAIASWRKRYADAPVNVVAVMLGGSLESQRRFAADHDLPSENIVIDRGGFRRKPFGVVKSPTTIMIGPDSGVGFTRAGLVRPRDGAFHAALADQLRAGPRRPPPGALPGAFPGLPPGQAPPAPTAAPPEAAP